MSITILDPTHELHIEPSTLAPRLESLEGTVIGVISNGKEGTVGFFDHVSRRLRERHGVAEVVRRVKSNYSAPAEDELMREALGWSAVLAGVGD